MPLFNTSEMELLCHRDLSYKNILVHAYTVARVQRALQPYGAINNEPEF